MPGRALDLMLSVTRPALGVGRLTGGRKSISTTLPSAGPSGGAAPRNVIVPAPWSIVNATPSANSVGTPAALVTETLTDPGSSPIADSPTGLPAVGSASSTWPAKCSVKRLVALPW